MERRSRFIFHGHAAAFGGHIIRPKNIVLEAHGASALLVSGGRSIARLQKTQFEDFVAVDSATTLAEGLFDDPAQYEESTHGRISRADLTATTRVSAEVIGVVVGQKPRLTIRRLRGGLTAKSPLAGGHPAINVDANTVIEGADIDGHRLAIDFHTTALERCNTWSKLLVAADDAAFVKEFGDALFMRTPIDGRSAPARGRLNESRGTIYATIVKSIRWDGDPFPGSEIEGNAVHIPELGRLYFGELLITEASRRVTLLRIELGSPTGGDVAFADYQDNGSWS